MRQVKSVLVAIVSALALLAIPAAASASSGTLEMYTATVDGEQLGAVTAGGYDVASVESTADGANLDLVLSPGERADLRRKGIETSLLRNEAGLTVAEQAARQAVGGYEVYRDYDGADGLEKAMRKLAKKNPDIVDLQTIGQTTQGRDILALRVTRGAGKSKAGSKPAVLYQGTTHAREWISTEVTLRLLDWFVANDEDERVRRILKSTELWFVPVVNPDGYQYTFDSERLWRKNLRDNNGDGEITNGDGVDLNRNYPERWNYDDEGSATQTSDETYRGPAAGSEPETQADMRLFDKVDFSFAVSYHSFGPLLLYPQGWQVQTPTPDDPIYQALTGTDDDPAVKGFDPDLAAELYTTNGEFTDWAHGERGTLAWTPELDEGCEGCGFVFPDDEKLVQKEFRKNRAFALDLARSAKDPAAPKSHLGNETKPFYLSTLAGDATRAGNPDSDLRFPVSYGGPQDVQILARRGIGRVQLRYSVNGGKESKARTSEWDGGERYGEGYATYYHQLRGTVKGAQPGDEVEVYFKARGKRSKSFTYSVAEDTGGDVLVVAAEDYSGIANSPPYPGGSSPSYLGYYTDSLEAAGLSWDLYDVDAMGRTAPDALGVLGHYDAIVWYTGNDLVTREPDGVPGGASRLANDEMLELRSYLNEGGKLLYSGQYAGYQYAFGYAFDPLDNAPCFAGYDEVDARCQLLSDDFLQYYLGAYIYNDDAGTDDNGPLDVTGIQSPYEGLDWGFNGGTSADNQEHTASFLTTGSLLSQADYPLFESGARAAYVSQGASPFEPLDGERYMYSDRASYTYKRLSRSFDLSGLTAADNPTLDFSISYDTEVDWDHVIVEIHHAGQDDWTTLPDLNGHTANETGESCPAGWTEDLHPFLKHYQTLNDDGTCSPTGTSGEWNSGTGRSQGWEDWSVDLSAYAGDDVEISISYVSDYAVQGVGAFVDKIVGPAGQGTTSFEEDGNPLDGWSVPGAPADSPANANDWRQTASVDFEEGAVVSTDDTLYFGFGLEGITDADDRDRVMSESMDYLLGPTR